MDTQSYLQRINYQGSLVPTADTLKNLQLAHHRSVPFENLSIHSGETIILENEALFEKIVRRRRGGFCYELNGLFASLLRELGFDVVMLAANVFNPTGELGPDFDHMTLLVRLEQRWLVDVGFGDSFLEPLLLDTLSEQVQGNRSYYLRRQGEHLILMQRVGDEDWKRQYRFTLEPHDYPDYEEMCRYHQTSPDSHFTKARLCSLATPNGRVTLSGMRFITTSLKGDREERLLNNDDEYSAVLREHFGIVLRNV